ncbi:MAG: glycosyltransferase family 39 protein [bacterium]
MAAVLEMTEIKKALTYLILAITLATGCITIFYHLERPFESDRPAARVVFSSQNVMSLIKDPPDFRHPSLYYIALHYSLKMFGGSGFSAYLPGAIFGLACIAALFFFLERRVGLLAAAGGSLLLSVTPEFIGQSREVANFSLFSLLSLLSSYYFLKCAFNRDAASPRKTDFLFYIISTVLCFYCNFFAFFIAAAQFLFLSYIRFSTKRLDKNIVYAYLLCILLGVPSLIMLAKGFFMDIPVREAASQASQEVYTGAWEFMMRTAAEYFPFDRGFLPFGMGFALLMILYVAFYYLFSDFRIRQFPDLIYILIVVLLTVTISFAATDTVRLRPYYFVFLWPLLTVFFFEAIDRLCREEIKNAAIRNAVYILFMGIVVFAYSYMLNNARDDFYGNVSDRSIAPAVRTIVESRHKSRRVVLEYIPDVHALYYHAFDYPYRDYDRYLEMVSGRGGEMRGRRLSFSVMDSSLAANVAKPGDFENPAASMAKREKYWFIYNKRHQNPNILKPLESRCSKEYVSTVYILFYCDPGGRGSGTEMQ